MFALSPSLQSTQDNKPGNTNYSTWTVVNSTRLSKSILFSKTIIYEKYHNHALSRKKEV